MSTKFSPMLRAEDLNDFRAPSQACPVPLKRIEANTNIKRPDRSEAAIGINRQEASVKLSDGKDCLDCSACITSTKMVTPEKQSSDEFLSNIDGGKAVIVSLSPQSRTSLAVHFGLSPLQVFRKLTKFFKSLGVKAVFDTSCSRDLTLIETCNEFVSRFKESLCEVDRSKVLLPMLSSACPGWIFHAEKEKPYVLPYISSVKSPQQTIGAIIKRHVCHKMGLRPDDIYHVTVMPCYKKKLEAARDDFSFELEAKLPTSRSSIRITEVDLVLTSGEILDLIKLKEVDFEALEESPLDRLLTNVDEQEHLYGVAGGSGGYAETVFRYAAKALFGREIEGRLEFKTKRNTNFREVSLIVDEKVVLKFAQCYGYQNLENILREVKNKKYDHHFVEVMACPSGCLNGDGQIKPMEGEGQKILEEWLRLTEAVYMENVRDAEPRNNPLVRGLYEEWLGQAGSEEAKRYMHTEYRPLVKSRTAELQDW